MQGLDFNTYEGFQQEGRAEKIFLRGKLTVDQGKFMGEKGQGKFVKREPYGFAYAGQFSKWIQRCLSSKKDPFNLLKKKRGLLYVPIKGRV